MAEPTSYVTVPIPNFSRLRRRGQISAGTVGLMREAARREGAVLDPDAGTVTFRFEPDPRIEKLETALAMLEGNAPSNRKF
jgi:hypothetical protein